MATALPMGWPVGIDLGTTYSCVGVFRNGTVDIISNEQGNRITPSCVAFTNTERLIGDPAKGQMTMNPTNTVYDAKSSRFGDVHWPPQVTQLERVYANFQERLQQCISKTVTTCLT
ncbi:unnamed protein product [Acanthoscelides obtectus]|uniref:Uncharacterized protein n=1 Tax=Acanthoscelides obtectus TaxID=200917 RepID=A0A9P0PJ81_ACAOB|nr:unnamed protein product [Acanthoscelides obtectus]CAK1681623.1 hypothetical protein AOBTE_LOCUS33170 [Acanthoscelides obtectus]